MLTRGALRLRAHQPVGHSTAQLFCTQVARLVVAPLGKPHVEKQVVVVPPLTRQSA